MISLSERDKKGGNPNSRKHLVVEEIKDCNLYDLNDIWGSLNPNAEQFTWRNKSFKIQCHSLRKYRAKEKLVKSIKEALRALNEFKNKKSPGTDGIQAEF